MYALMFTRLNSTYAINILNNFHLAIMEVVYLSHKGVRRLLMVPCVERPIGVMYDKDSLVAISKNSKCHSKAKISLYQREAEKSMQLLLKRCLLKIST